MKTNRIKSKKRVESTKVLPYSRQTAKFRSVGVSWLIALLAINACCGWAVAASERTRCMAYLDPGTGSLILQMLLAGLVTSGFLLKIFWHKITTLFCTVFGGKKENKDNDA